MGAGVLALGAVGLGVRRGATHPVPALQAFDARAFRTLEAVVDRVVPGGDGFPSPRELGIAAQIDAHVATLHPADQAELQQALHLLENALAGLLLDGRTQPFSVASPEARDRALRAWQSSSIGALRRGFKALRGLCASTYFGNPAVYAAVGYPGPPDFGQAGAPAIQPVQRSREQPREQP